MGLINTFTANWSMLKSHFDVCFSSFWDINLLHRAVNCFLELAVCETLGLWLHACWTINRRSITLGWARLWELDFNGNGAWLFEFDDNFLGWWALFLNDLNGDLGWNLRLWFNDLELNLRCWARARRWCLDNLDSDLLFGRRWRTDHGRGRWWAFRRRDVNWIWSWDRNRHLDMVWLRNEDWLASTASWLWALIWTTDWLCGLRISKSLPFVAVVANHSDCWLSSLTREHLDVN